MSVHSTIGLKIQLQERQSRSILEHLRIGINSEMNGAMHVKERKKLLK